MLPTSTKILRAIERGLIVRDKSIELDLTLRKLTIEVLFDSHTHQPKKVLYNHHGEDDLVDGKKAT
jgi:hypothetical protein